MRSSPLVIGRRGRAGERGQALLIAVLVLFAVGTLAALFVALIGSQLAQVARQSDVVALRSIAEAGLRLANEQLTYSPAGADWRPSSEPYDCGAGQVTISVSYGPTPGEIQSRFLRIMATAVLPDNPFLRHTILALKPVLLTDYARFITDRYETNRAANLGVSGLELGGYPRPDYVTYIEGPIRSNTDLVWYGQNVLSLHTTFDAMTDWSALGMLRDDRIEVAGQMLPPANPSLTDVVSVMIDGITRTDDLFSPNSESEQYDYGNGFPQEWEGEVVPNSRAVLSGLPEVFTGEEYLSPGLAVPRVTPPEIDAVHPDKDTNRYLSLTRDAGFWVQDASDYYYNTGEFGWGWSNYGGIYIDNFDDIQYNHDLEKLRLNFTQSVGAHQPPGDLRAAGTAIPPAGPADWWDKTGRYYAPPAVEIIVHGEYDCPWVEIIRHDLREAGGVYYYWRKPNGEPIDFTDPDPDNDYDLSYPYDPGPSGCRPQLALPAGIYDGNRAVFPFPANGVIYAEGNVRIRGIMPPVRDSLGRRGLDIPVAEVPRGYFGDWQEVTGRSRRFDMQVVSGGTSYIEGDLMSPSTAGLTGLVAGDYVNDARYGSRIALLARDYVCVNTTALNPRPRELFQPVTRDVFGVERTGFYNDLQPQYTTQGPEGQQSFQGAPTITDADVQQGAPVSYETYPESIPFIYRNARLQVTELADQLADLRLIIGHTGLYVSGATTGADGTIIGAPTAGGTLQPSNGPDADEPDVSVALHVNDPTRAAAMPWDFGGTSYSFVRPAVATPDAADESDHWYTDTLPGTLELGDPAADDWLELVPHDYQSSQVHSGGVSVLTGYDVIEFVSRVTPVRVYDYDATQYVSFATPPKELAYLLGPVAVAPPNRDEGTGLPPDPLPVDIDALIYAQNGSWVVLPGRWFNEDPDDFGVVPTGPAPGYHEPLNIRLSVYGAISENRPADLGLTADWTSKWCGPQDTSGIFLSYRYDPLLRWPRLETAGETTDLIGYTRFPNFPITSDLVIWGERITGPAGT